MKVWTNNGGKMYRGENEKGLEALLATKILALDDFPLRCGDEIASIEWEDIFSGRVPYVVIKKEGE